MWPKRKNASKREDDKSQANRASGGALYCVRTCDGFYFPAHAGSNATENSKTCNALCPGAATEPYRVGTNDDIGTAVSSKGKSYASLPAAFSYRAGLKEGCACKSQAKTGFAALLEDATLAPNDIVVTEAGIRVFIGSGGVPHRESDFVPYRKVRGMERGLVAYLHSIDRLLPRSEARRSSDATGATPPSPASGTRRGKAKARMASGAIDALNPSDRDRLAPARHASTAGRAD